MQQRQQNPAFYFVGLAPDSLTDLSAKGTMSLLGHDRLPASEIYFNLSPDDAIRVFQNKW
jgi:hypothetical protein